jgi:hypothetical protein
MTNPRTRRRTKKVRRQGCKNSWRPQGHGKKESIANKTQEDSERRVQWKQSGSQTDKAVREGACEKEGRTEKGCKNSRRPHGHGKNESIANKSQGGSA